MIYFYPPTPSGQAYVSVLQDQYLIALTIGTNNVTFSGMDKGAYYFLFLILFSGIIFEVVQNNAINATQTVNTTIFNCTVRNTGNLGVFISSGTKEIATVKEILMYFCTGNHNWVSTSTFKYTGLHGIELIGGDRPSLTSAYFVVYNNDISCIFHSQIIFTLL
jgi:hypothetical protein